MAQVILHPREGRSPKDYALMYAGLGWKVFPVWPIASGMLGDGEAGRCTCPMGEACDRPGKHPLADLAPGGVSDASSERVKIENWWGSRPAASIGIATGAASGLTVVDADAGGGKPGVINLTRLCAERGGVPATFTVHTGGGGLHLYFKYNAELRTGANVLDEAIDVRNDGGYVIAPPSGHYSGGVYKWREERAEIIDVPEWMIGAPAQAEGRAARRRGRPRTREGLPLEKVESLLACVDSDDRDRWLKVGLLLGKLFVGSEAEGEAWALYEAWAARSEKFDEARAENIERMREQFFEASQQAPRPGATPLGVGTLIMWAKEGGWSPFGERVTVRYEPGNESKMCAELVGALVAQGQRNRFFAVSGEVRDVIHYATPSVRLVIEARARGEDPPQTLALRKTLSAGLQSALSDVAVLTVPNKDGIPTAKPIPTDLVNMILRDHVPKFPALSGVAEWPLVKDGEIVSRPTGYDAETTLYFDIASSVAIDEAMSAEQGWNWLREEFFVDFPFEGVEARGRALAMMLAMLLRPIMKMCPAFAVVAPQAGTGKSTLIEAACYAVQGASITSHAFSADEEELRKALHALMLSKASVVMFDNVGRGRTVASDHIAKLITSETSSDRTLGSSETRKESNTLLITFTGNNIAFVRDLASRVVMIRLNAAQANPIGRSFRHPDIKAWASAQRNRVLSALIAIAKVADGAMPEGGQATRFDDYDRMIVKPIKAVTGIDVRGAVEDESEFDTEEAQETKDALAAIYSWQQTQRDGQNNGKPWRTAELLAAINAHSMPEAVATLLKQWAGDARRWENDAATVLGHALRAARDNHRYEPYVLKNKIVSKTARWQVRNLEAVGDDTNPGETF